MKVTSLVTPILAAVATVFVHLTSLQSCYAKPLEVRVGLITSLSGNWAPFGDMTLKGAQLANEQLAREGLVAIKFEVEDSNEHTSGLGAVTAYRSLRSKGITLFIGPGGTPGGLAIAPILAKDSSITISPSVGVEGFHRAGPNVFNSMGTYEIASRLLARRAYQDGARRVGIFTSQQPYETIQADAFEAAFKRLGGEISARVDPNPESLDLRGEALRITRSKPDAVFLAVYNQLAIATKELQQLGYKGPKYAPLVDRSRFEGAQGALDGVIFAKLGETEPAFIEAFRAKYGREPDFPADFAHDAVIALGEAVAQTGSTNLTALIPALAAVQFRGASGEFNSMRRGA